MKWARRADGFFLVASLLAGGVLVFLTPPFQVPDPGARIGRRCDDEIAHPHEPGDLVDAATGDRQPSMSRSEGQPSWADSVRG